MIKPAMTPEEINEEQCKIRTYRNLVPAHTSRLKEIDVEIERLVSERKALSNSIDEMRVFLLARGETPMTYEEWRKQ